MTPFLRTALTVAACIWMSAVTIWCGKQLIDLFAEIMDDNKEE